MRTALKDTDTARARHADEVRRLISRFCGFEFLVAPYTVAHLKISQVLKENYKFALGDGERLSIYLTNTLESAAKSIDEINNVFVAHEIRDEFIHAQNIKQKPILIITGNPPYSGASANKGIFENEVKIAYGLEPALADLPPNQQRTINAYLSGLQNGRKEKSDKEMREWGVSFRNIYAARKLQNEKNPKWLLDDYVKFIRFAESKIHAQERGIVAIISNNSFLDNPTFRGMRYRLLQTFDEIFVLDLHGNFRKKELATDGGKDENVFNIQQGVCISIFVKNGSNSNLARLRHAEIYGKRREKFDFLAGRELGDVEWRELHPSAPFYLFIPQNNDLREQYDKGWSVREIFGASSVGVVTGRDKILIAANVQKLEFAVRGFYNEFDEKFVQNIAYRPFDTQKIYYDTNKVTRPRSEIMKHFLDGENVGLVCDRGCKLQQIDNCFISDKIIDLHLVGSGSYIFPLYLKTGETRTENFTAKFREFLRAKYAADFTPQQVLGYIYALLYHKNYREKYLDFLKIDFPKIPFCAGAERFLALSELGRRLIDVHLLKGADLRGAQNAVREGRFLQDKNGKNIQNHVISRAAYNPATREIFVNDSLHFGGVSAQMWGYKIGGYAVLEKYLKSHKGEVLDTCHFERVIAALDTTLALEAQIAAISLEVE